MKKLKAWMAEHKKFSVIALCLLLMFTCGSAMSAINVSHHRAETAKEQNAGNNTDTTTAAEKKTKEETGKVELTDAQKEIIKGYDTDAKELIDTLSSSVWSVSEGRYTLKFADDSYVETVNGTPTVHSYAISRVEKTSDGYGGYLYTIVFETDTGTHIVTYTDGSGAAVNSDSKTPGENTISTLTSSTMFAQKNTAYERAEAVANITVKGMNSEVTKLFGGDEKAVTTALSKWCAVHYPSVTEATWQKVVNLDYENGVITTDSSSTTQTLFPSPAFTSSPRASSPSRARATSPCRQKGISMNEQLTLQSTQHEETKTVPLRRRKACLAGTFALFAACALVLLIPHPAYAGIIGDFLDIPNMIKTWLLQIAATLFNTYFGVINQTLDAKFISGPFNELFGTTEPYGVVKDFYQAGVIPVAHAILGLFMLMQLIKISQRIDATSTLPAVKDIVFLVVTYCILSYFIDNALDLVSAIYSIFNDLVGNVSDKLQSKNWYEPGIKMTKDDAADATFGGCFLLLIFGLISWAVGLVFYAVSMVVALGRSVQLYVYAAFSPIPISLLGFEETKQIGIGYLKNFAAAALAGVVMVLILYLYPHLVTALAVSGGLGKAEMLGLAQGVETFDSFGVIIKTIAVLITTMMGLVKSGSWAKEILGA